MEFLFTIIFVLFSLWFIKLILSFIITIIQYIFVERFKIKLNTLKDVEYSAIIVQGRGPIASSKPGRFRFFVIVFDVTEPKKRKPVLSLLPQLSNLKGLCLFEKFIEFDFPNPSLNKWVPVGFIIPELCVFPKKGARQLQIQFCISDQEDNIICHCEKEFPFYNAERGYEDLAQDKVKIFELKIQILMALCMADDYFCASEGHHLIDLMEDFFKGL